MIAVHSLREHFGRDNGSSAWAVHMLRETCSSVQTGEIVWSDLLTAADIFTVTITDGVVVLKS